MLSEFSLLQPVFNLPQQHAAVAGQDQAAVVSRTSLRDKIESKKLMF
jgi:hypothetical protein